MINNLGQEISTSVLTIVIGLYAGTATSLNALQWGGAGVALVGASLMAAMVFAWPESSPVKAKASPKA